MGFNPETWCNDVDEDEISKKPVKILICTAVRMLDLITPIIRFVKTMMEIALELILEANFLTEMIIVLSPLVPLAVLLGYFFDTL